MRIKNYIPPRINRENGKREMHFFAANYLGPNTDIMRRMKEQIKPTSSVDAAAKRHDLSYFNIRQMLRDKDIIPSLAKEKVRVADNLLIAEAERSKKGLFNPVNTAHAAAAITGMKSKKVAEDIGLLDELKFVGKGKKDPLKKLRKSMSCAKKSKGKKKHQTS